MRKDTKSIVFEAVRTAPEPVTANDVAALTGFDLITSSAAISNLVVDGRIKRTNNARPARYVVPDHGRQLPHRGVRPTPGPHPAFGFVCGRAA